MSSAEADNEEDILGGLETGSLLVDEDFDEAAVFGIVANTTDHVPRNHALFPLQTNDGNGVGHALPVVDSAATSFVSRKAVDKNKEYSFGDDQELLHTSLIAEHTNIESTPQADKTDSFDDELTVDPAHEKLNFDDDSDHDANGACDSQEDDVEQEDGHQRRDRFHSERGAPSGTNRQLKSSTAVPESLDEVEVLDQIPANSYRKQRNNFRQRQAYKRPDFRVDLTRSQGYQFNSSPAQNVYINPNYQGQVEQLPNVRLARVPVASTPGRPPVVQQQQLSTFVPPNMPPPQTFGAPLVTRPPPLQPILPFPPSVPTFSCPPFGHPGQLQRPMVTLPPAPAFRVPVQLPTSIIPPARPFATAPVQPAVPGRIPGFQEWMQLQRQQLPQEAAQQSRTTRDADDEWHRRTAEFVSRAGLSGSSREGSRRPGGKESTHSYRTAQDVKSRYGLSNRKVLSPRASTRPIQSGKVTEPVIAAVIDKQAATICGEKYIEDYKRAEEDRKRMREQLLADREAKRVRIDDSKAQSATVTTATNHPELKPAKSLVDAQVPQLQRLPAQAPSNRVVISSKADLTTAAPVSRSITQPLRKAVIVSQSPAVVPVKHVTMSDRFGALQSTTERRVEANVTSPVAATKMISTIGGSNVRKIETSGEITTGKSCPRLQITGPQSQSKAPKQFRVNVHKVPKSYTVERLLKEAEKFGKVVKVNRNLAEGTECSVTFRSKDEALNFRDWIDRKMINLSVIDADGPHEEL